MEPRLRLIVCFVLLALPYFCIAQISDVAAFDFAVLSQEASKKHISSRDITGLYMADHYTSQGITHTYFFQAIDSIPIFDTDISIHQYKSGRHSQFNIIHNISNYHIDNKANVQPNHIISRLTDGVLSLPTKISESNDVRKTSIWTAPSLSINEIEFKLWYYKRAKDSIGLAWEFLLENPDDGNLENYFVDAINGDVIKRIPLTFNCGGHQHVGLKSANHCGHEHSQVHNDEIIALNQYNVFSYPIESPNHGSRSMANSPWLANPIASPEGWHVANGVAYQHTLGNNVDAYEDWDNSNSPSSGNLSRADGGSNLNFDFPWSATGTPIDYKDAAVTNVFYWINLCHDVWYNYGFDEASGNFQKVNYTSSGVGNDIVLAEVQNGGGNCKANFNTPVDGTSPRMQLFTCSENGVIRDGAFDSGVIIHEYAHGLSKRLTGGPANSNCLANAEQMGEGWSDFLGLMMTMTASDMNVDSRGFATWFVGEDANGNGIRPYPYSTDMGINPMTYDTIKLGNITVPHGIGAVWASMLWELAWAMIDEYGFDPDLYNGNGGNNKSMRLVIEALKMQPCSPGFVDGRDAILAADLALFNGLNQCLIWKAFAKRGLGFSASQGSTSSRSDGTEAYDLPPSCITITTISASKLSASPLDTIEYTVKVKNGLDTDLLGIIVKSFIPDTTTFIEASQNGIAMGNEVVWAPIDLFADDSIVYTFKVLIDANKSIGSYEIIDDVESGNLIWQNHHVGSTQFVIQSNQAQSGNFAWFAHNASSSGTAYLDLEHTIGLDSNSILTFSHYYNTETNWDGGRVFISTDLGESWISMEPYFIQNGYNGLIVNTHPGFSGFSGGFITSKIDLSSFVEEAIIIRFQMDCDQLIGDLGWYIDDVSITNLNHIIDNNAEVHYSSSILKKALPKPTCLDLFAPLSISLEKTDVSCGGNNDGNINLIVNGGAGDHVIQWNNGSSTEDLTNIAAGTYTVAVSNADTIILDSVTILGGFHSVVTDAFDDGGSANLRHYVEIESCPNDTIFFHPDLLGSSIYLNTRLTVQNPINIIGLGKNDLTIDGQGNDILFLNPISKSLSIENIGLKNGASNTDGGAILNLGTLKLKNTLFENNYEGQMQKAFTNKGLLTIEGFVDLKQ